MTAAVIAEMVQSSLYCDIMMHSRLEYGNQNWLVETSIIVNYLKRSNACQIGKKKRHFLVFIAVGSLLNKKMTSRRYTF